MLALPPVRQEEVAMAFADSPSDAVLHALGFALFFRDDSGALRAPAEQPPWLKALWPEAQSIEKNAFAPDVSPFLENFLIDAEECWREGGEKRVGSGPWVEQNAQGDVVQLEATALTIDGQAILVLERLGQKFEAKKAILQTARETVIAYQRLNSEIQKKEILLHCVAEDMSAALANIVTALRLLELENNSPKSRLLLGLATRATEEQQALIHKVLAVFAEELSGLFGQDGGAISDADLQTATLRAMEMTASICAEKKVDLLPPASGEAKVPLDPRHLERVIANLIENALEHTSAGGKIALTIEPEAEAVLLCVDDNGEAVSPDACDDLFSKFEPVSAVSHASLLRLHFCRMIVEDGGGEIGCGGGEGGWNRFWIRLPKSAS